MKEKTLEEVAERYYPIPINNTGSMFMPTTHESNNNFIQIGFIAGAKWQAERMYSAEDLRNAYRWGTLVNQGTKEHFNEWFEQFKKK